MTGTDVTNSTSADCEMLRELLPAYTLGIADPDERELVEHLMVECPEVWAESSEEREEYRELGDGLLLSAPTLEPPPHLLANLLKEATPQSAPESLPAIPAGAVSRFSWHFPAVAAAVIILLLGLNVFSLHQITTLQATQNQLAAQMSRQASVLTLFARDEVTRFELHDAREDAGVSVVSAVVLCNPMETVGVIHAENFPPLSPDGRYQVWLWRDDERTSAGIMDVDADGNGTFIFEAPDVMGTYHYVGIAPVLPVDAVPTGPIVTGPLYEPG